MFELLSSQGFLEFLERGYGAVDAGSNLVDKVQEAMGKGDDLSMVLSEPLSEPEIFTVSDYESQTSGCATVPLFSSCY